MARYLRPGPRLQPIKVLFVEFSFEHNAAFKTYKGQLAFDTFFIDLGANSV